MEHATLRSEIVLQSASGDLLAQSEPLLPELPHHSQDESIHRVSLTGAPHLGIEIQGTESWS